MTFLSAAQSVNAEKRHNVSMVLMKDTQHDFVNKHLICQTVVV